MVKKKKRKNISQIKERENSISNELSNKTTPKIDLERFKDYCKELDESIKSKDEKNIAIAGIFGAGKSSLVKTYEYIYNNKVTDKLFKKIDIKELTPDKKDEFEKQLERHKIKNKMPSLKISLANFNVVSDKQAETLESKKSGKEELINDPIEDDKDQRTVFESKEREMIAQSFNDLNDFRKKRGQLESIENKKELNKEIEKNLLQQFLFGVKQSKLPDSKINRITNHSYYKRITLALFILGLLFSSICLTNHFSLIWNYNIVIEKIFISISIITLIIILALISLTFKIKSLKIDKIELHALDDKNYNEESILNKFTDEIIYIFKRSKIQVVYFEDLDRLPNLNIFNKLRELNFILNNSPDIGKKISFVYCISDNIIADYEERVKFFDKIITLTPFTTEENLKSKIEQILTHSITNPDKSLISEYALNMSKFMVDSRLSIHIENDFNKYIKAFDSKTMNTKQLIKAYTFAIYKNLYYYDYNKLDKNKSCLNYAFQLIRYLKKDEIKTIKNELDKKENLLLNAQKDQIAPFEVCKTFFAGIVFAHGITNCYSNSALNIINLTPDKINDYDYLYIEFSNSRKYLSVADIESYFIKSFNKSFDEYIELLDLSNKDKLKELHTEIENLNNKIKLIENMSAAEFLTTYECKEINNEFLYICLSKGYIESDFKKYFDNKDSFLNDNDDAFVRYNVYNEQNLALENNFIYSINDIDKVILNIPNERFKSHKILNINLLNYMLENKPKYDKKMENLKQLLSSKNEFVYKFYVDYLKTQDAEECSKITELFYNTEEFVLAFIAVAGTIDRNKQTHILELLLKKCDLSKISHKEEFLNFINAYTDWNDINITDSIVNNLNTLGTFSLTNIEKLNDSSLKNIFDNCKFEINYANLHCILNRILKEKDDQLLLNKLLTYNDENVKNYLIANLAKILSIINVQNVENSTLDLIIDDSVLTAEQKISFINKHNISYKVTRIIDKNLLKTIVDNMKITLDIENIFKTYLQLKDESFEKYFDKTLFNKISFTRLYLIKDETEFNNFKDNVVMPKILSYENNIEIAKAFNLTDIELKEKVEPLYDIHLNRLIKSDILKISIENFNNLNECLNSYFELIIKSPDIYLEFLKEESLVLTNNLVTFLVGNINNVGIKTYLVNKYIDKIDFSYEYNLSKINVNLLEKVSDVQINNKNVIKKIFASSIEDPNIKSKKIELLEKYFTLFTSDEIFQLLCEIDENFKNCNNQQYDFHMPLEKYLEQGLKILQNVNFIKMRKIFNKIIRVNKV